MSEQQKIITIEKLKEENEIIVMELEDKIEELEVDRDDYKSYCDDKDDEVKCLQEEIAGKDELIKTKDKIIRDMKEMALKLVRFQ